MRQSGFTLLELSIVLVIIGLIIGGVTVGSALIRQAELGTVQRDMNRYMVAMNTFKLKFNAYPGDFSKAQSYWPGCFDFAGPPANPCNGDGNGALGDIESYRVWQHLSLGGMISGSYTGEENTTPGENMPKSPISDGSWRVFYGWLAGGIQPKNWLRLAGTANFGNGPLFTAGEAMSLDQKMDNGIADTGRFITRVGNDSAGNPLTGCIDNATTSKYKLDSDAILCKIHYAFKGD